jgi:quercetin dioxygenase-like cupin family protein
VKLGKSRSIIPATVLAIVAVAAVSSAVFATSPIGQTASNLVAGTLTSISVINTDRIKFQTKGDVDVAMFTVTYAGGGTSGWHTHPGFLLVTVKTGTVLRQIGCAAPTPYTEGATFVESDEQPAGRVSNASASTDAVLQVTQVVPHLSLRRVEASEPAC